MKLDVYNLQNEKTGEIEVFEAVFDAPIKEYLHHEVVRWQRACRRRGTVSTKGRAEVAGSKHKMYRQKGTGRARHSTSKAPQFVGGGVAFGPHPRSFAYRLPKRVRKVALRSVLSQKAREGQIKVVEEFALPEIKTREAFVILQRLGAAKALVVDGASNQTLRLSARNLRDYKYLAPEGLNVMDLLRFDQLILTRSALECIQGALLP
ncbi:MAG: 50S ribosomal protein L4 [Bradymonadales bacterium]|nr:50S ribosomal protein L4 [Bradymonadales bacterium]